jgi:glucose/arabinose dehydrogenase
MIWEVDAQSGFHRQFATGLRNPTALAVQPGVGQLWAVVNERDELGPNLVPDYLTAVRQGAFYGWPYAYGGRMWIPACGRRTPRRSPLRSAPTTAWGPITPRWGSPFQLLPWERALQRVYSLASTAAGIGSEPVGYRVSFVPFRNGRPAGQPIDFATASSAATERPEAGRWEWRWIHAAL